MTEHLPTLTVSNLVKNIEAHAAALEPGDSRAAWLEWRRHGIGGSDIAGILGLSRYSSPWSVWADKVGLRPQDTPNTDAQHIGTIMEPVLDGLFTRRTGLAVSCQQTWCIDTDAPHRRCTIDGVAHSEADPAAVMLTSAGRFLNALGTVQHKTDYRRPFTDGPPADMRAQCIWEMGVTRLPHAWLSVLHGGNSYHVYDIPFDPDDWQFMCAEADRFWHDHVVTGIAPDIDGSDATADALRDVYPEEQPGARAEVSAEDVDRWRRMTARIRLAKAELQSAANALKAAAQDAEIGTVDGRAVITLRAQTRRQTCKACGHIEESEPFRVLRDAPKKLQDLPAVTDA